MAVLGLEWELNRPGLALHTGGPEFYSQHKFPWAQLGMLPSPPTVGNSTHFLSHHTTGCRLKKHKQQHNPSPYSLKLVPCPPLKKKKWQFLQVLSEEILHNIWVSSLTELENYRESYRQQTLLEFSGGFEQMMPSCFGPSPTPAHGSSLTYMQGLVCLEGWRWDGEVVFHTWPHFHANFVITKSSQTEQFLHPPWEKPHGRIILMLVLAFSSWQFKNY